MDRIIGTNGMDDASAPSEAEVWEALESANLARVTKDNHRRRLRFLTNELYKRRTKTPLLHLLLHPAYALKSIEGHTQDPHTRRTYVSSILAAFKWCPQLKQHFPKEFDRWQEFEKEERHKINDQILRNEPTTTQAAKAVNWEDVRDLPYRMPEGSFERLMVSLYVMQEPNRNDYSPCYNSINCIKLGPKPEVCISYHKTRSSHGTIRKPLPEELKREIEASVEHFPRNWLFCDARTGRPWSAQYFRQVLAKVFQHWLGKRLGASTLRHSFINAIDFNRTSLKEVSEYARHMGQTIGTLRKYAYAGQSN